MYCPKCGSVIGEQSDRCKNCGEPITEISNLSSETHTAETITAQTCQTGAGQQELSQNLTERKFKITTLSVVLFTVAIVTLILLFIAAHKVSNAGIEIMKIQSVGGKTLEEAYYFELGNLYAGYAMVIRGIGIFFASILVVFGLKTQAK
ncbi:MAG: hypothetical protein RR347_05320 [Anaerovoracaceae bacterium]